MISLKGFGMERSILNSLKENGSMGIRELAVWAGYRADSCFTSAVNRLIVLGKIEKRGARYALRNE